MLVKLARSDIEAYIRVIGDATLEGNEYEVAYGKVEMIVTSSDTAADPMKYSDILSVLTGIAMKMSRDGYVNTSVRVFRTGQPNTTIGLAAVYRPGITRDVSA